MEGDRIGRLDAIGFIWNARVVKWEDKFSALVKYKEAYGDCNVPQSWIENPKLGAWIGNQRQTRKQGTLSDERVRRLKEIGFIWESNEAAWEEKFSNLIKYKEAHGDCKVPMGWIENPSLGQWADAQRQARKKGTLSEARVRRLEEIGFIWELLEAVWDDLFAALTEYKQAHGDCNVPQKWPEHPELGTWVNTQRGRRKKGVLSKERTRRLDEIEFIWGN